MKNSVVSKKKKFSVFELIVGLCLVVYSAILFTLFIWAIINSLKTGIGFDEDKLFYLSAETITFSNYVNAFKAVRILITKTNMYAMFLQMFLNSFLYAGGCAFFGTLVPCLTAYVTTKYKCVFNKVIYFVVIFCMVTPVVGNLPSQVQMLQGLNLYDSHLGLWFMSAYFIGTYFLVFQATFKGLSWEYAESAFIDGASHLTVLTKIMFPLVKNTFMVIFLLNFISRWNDFQTPWIYMPSYPVAAVGVQFFSAGGEGAYGIIPIRIAASIILLLPTLILFLCFKNKLVGNLTVGGIKG